MQVDHEQHHVSFGTKPKAQRSGVTYFGEARAGHSPSASSRRPEPIDIGESPSACNPCNIHCGFHRAIRAIVGSPNFDLLVGTSVCLNAVLVAAQVAIPL